MLLDLSSNSITGPIPSSSIAKLTDLENLNVSRNKLTGSINSIRVIGTDVESPGFRLLLQRPGLSQDVGTIYPPPDDTALQHHDF